MALDVVIADGHDIMVNRSEDLVPSSGHLWVELGKKPGEPLLTSG